MQQPNTSSAPVFSLYYIAIDTEAGVTPEQFESFVRQKGVQIPSYPGWSWTLLRGLRGERAGQYLMLFEIDSSAERDRYVAADGNKTELARQFWREHPEALDILGEWKRYGTFSELPTLYNRLSTAGGKHQKHRAPWPTLPGAGRGRSLSRG